MKIPLLNKLRRTGTQIKLERTHYGIKFYLPEALSEDELLKLLVRIPPSAYKLPEEQGVALDFSGRECSRRLILHMLNSIVWEKGIRVVSWLSGSEESRKLFKAAGLSVTEPPLNLSDAKKPESPETSHEHNHIPALKIVYGSMRSGHKVDTEGDVLVWGHMNPGAEIVAGGSVIVAGKLLGVVHAGGYGRTDVFVWAGQFETPQVRIANKLCFADPKSTTCWRKSVLITLEDGTPVIRENKFLQPRKLEQEGTNI
ncbi:MAG: hypothetical protein IJG51_03340 [Synergistaceae bacterium]|nr:hypothetical protein [Synergistaceae bacterium]MBQ3345630.1 hypothetical protein [Synergistaceae bacterium]MBQ3397905.1 hypothetical protein [Synergistaceae bacterium]MBQ3758301.1 hypothetical protein [Synergistaceae bacterium]MBQ6115335.1 hypothetical protein [Synergistaceae bacterium]